MISDAIRNKSRAVIPYITAGMPDLETTGRIIKALSDAGAAAIEIGLPFSDPMADGPVLQKASHMALQAGFTMEGLMKNLQDWVSLSDVPLIIMSYINPIMRGGMKETLERFREKGIEGVIIPDLPADAQDLFHLCSGIGIDLIRLVAPTTTVSRQKEVISGCSGFVYAVSVKGVTGARTALPEEVSRQVKAIREMTDLPVCVGFGVSTARQVDDMLAFADGVIVGSHLMSAVIDSPDPVRAAYTCFQKLRQIRQTD